MTWTELGQWMADAARMLKEEDKARKKNGK